MHEWTESPSLRAHMEAVAACTRAYAATLAPTEQDRWEVAGLLHDMDYEKHPTPQEHPRVGVAHLESLGVDDEIRDAILGHADYTGVPRVSPMSKALYAVDELAGFIVACAKVRPDGITSLEAKSVKKKLKDKAFAAAVSREDIAHGIADLATIVPGLDEPAHIATCIDAVRAARARIGV
ncbi:MAG: HDIG domain-containing metalloprotein [Phycisphaerales bacterium]